MSGKALAAENLQNSTNGRALQMLSMFKMLLWIWREPAPPIATYDNTAEKWERAFLRRKEWLESKPMPGAVGSINASRSKEVTP